MSKANDLLAEKLSEFPQIPIIREYKPFEVDYVAAHGNTKGIREWMKKNNLNNFALDFAIPSVKMYVEIQGSGGFSHRGAGAVRDYKKNNQLVKAGWRGLVFPALEVKPNAQYICEEIEDLWQRLVRKTL